MPQPPDSAPREERVLTDAERQPLKREEVDERKPPVRGEDERSPEERKAILAEKVASLVSAGHEVEYMSPFDAVLVRKQHFGRKQRVLVSVDELGVLAVKDE
jgi:hypothetical protein